MPWIDSSQLLPDQTYQGHKLSPLAQHQIYNGLDCCLTTEIHQELRRQAEPPAIYQFELALQAPYLEIMQRGFKVNQAGRAEVAQELRGQMQYLQSWLDELAFHVWGKGLNPRSPAQLKDFFFGARNLNLPEVWQSKKGVRSLSTDREALEKLHSYLLARPFVNCILALRDLGKQLDVFEMEIDKDLRFRTSYNIAGTETGRPSSSKNAFGTGSNAQNINPQLRWPFESDPGYRLAVIDLEQVEARDVGFFIGCLFSDWDFLDNCESGDLHTNNAKRIWPGLGWTGEAKQDRAIADRMFYRDFSFRDMAKRGSHLSNYMGTAWTAARSLKVPQVITEEFQARYCKGGRDARGQVIAPAFPGIPRWWQWIAQQLQTTQLLTTPFGRARHFFGRPGDDTTLREAIAFLPQSTTADRMNLGLWRVWKHMPQCQLLAQTYDSITFQYEETLDENSILSEALSRIRVELISPSGRSYIVPGEAKVGWNWGAQVTKSDQEKAIARGRKLPRLNPDGLVKWSASKPDSRTRTSQFSRFDFATGK